MKNNFWALERAIRYNLFCAERAQKRISTSIPSANKGLKLKGKVLSEVELYWLVGLHLNKKQ
jgi:hypothetical protein